MIAEFMSSVSSTVLAFVFAGIIILLWVLFVYLPRWTRPDIYFGVTVRPEFRKTPQAAQIQRRYRRHVAFHSLIGLAMVAGSLLVPSTSVWSMVLLLTGLFWQIVGQVAALVAARRVVLGYAAVPASAREAALQPRQCTLAGRWWWLGPPIILLGFAIYLGLRWDDIPARVPTHWGWSGLPDSWADRGVAAVFMAIVMGFVAWAVLFAVAASLPRFTRRIASRGAPAEREQRFMRITQWILLSFAYCLAAVTGTVGLLPLSVGMNHPLPTWFYWTIGSELVLVVITILVLARTGQGGWRLEPVSGGTADIGEPTDTPPVGDRTPDAAWKLGLLYYNPDDPALLVEKHFGIGWTLNFGRPAVWLILLGILLLSSIAPIAFSLVVRR